MSERAWMRFCQHRFEDAWRNFFGRRGERKESKRRDGAGPDEIYNDIQDAGTAPLVSDFDVGSLNTARLEEIIAKTVSSIADPLVRAVAEDQFGPNPSPISSGTSENGKPALTDRLGVSRFRIYRALKQAH